MARVPVRHHGTPTFTSGPSDIASMVAMLLADEVAWIRGQSVG